MKSLPETPNYPITSNDGEVSQNALVLRPTLGLLFRTHILEVPDIIPVSQPIFHPAISKKPFLVRLGAAIVFLVHHAEYSISPTGRLRTWIKLLLKWFITLSLLCITVGVVGSIAASFIESISKLLLVAAQNLFWCALYLFGTIILLALLISGVFLFLSDARQKNQRSQDINWGRNGQGSIIDV